jgi:hypothetical protein
VAETPVKEVVNPMSTTSVLDQLQQVHELNRAFLGLLQSRARQEPRGILGLPPAVRPVIAAASAPLLDGVACFPRALFQLELDVPARARRAEPTHAVADFDEAEHDLCLLILLAARHTRRQSAYQARLLFCLPTAKVERLSTAPLADLQQLAGIPGVLGCTFHDRQWFWHGLFTATRPELRRQLTLMALQPGSAPGWPQRRPPQASA